jgi:hypothetical protein
MRTEDKPLNTAAELYREMATRGLEIRKTDARDNCLFDELLANLNCQDIELMKFLKKENISAKKFLLEFLKTVSPFSVMFQNIWTYLAKHYAPKVSENEIISIRFGLPGEDNIHDINLEQFRRYAEKARLIETIIQYSIWSENALIMLFELQTILNDNKRSTQYNRYRPGKYFELPNITVTDNPMDVVINDVRSVMLGIIDRYRIEMETTGDSETDSPQRHLAIILTDLLPGWYTIYEDTNAISDERKMKGLAYYEEHIKPYIDIENKIKQEEIEEALDILDLPFWKHRWHTYEIWSTVNILDNLAGFHTEPRIKDGRICLDGYSSEIIADVKNTMFPDACVAIQVQTDIQIGDKIAMKPDLRICFTNAIDEKDNTAAVIEFKQRKVITKDHIEEVALRYTNGAKKSGGVIITNYDITSVVPKLPPKSYYIEGVHPNNNSALIRLKDNLLSILNSVGFEQKKKRVVLMDISTSMTIHYDRTEVYNALQLYANNKGLKIYFFNEALVDMQLSAKGGYKIITTGGTNLKVSLDQLLEKEGNIDRLLVVTDGDEAMPTNLEGIKLYEECLPSLMGEKLTWILS